MDETVAGEALFAPGRPPVTLAELAPAALDGRLSTWRLEHPGWAVVRLRGRRCRDAADLFAEAAAALQFPSYFGANWDAFADCLTDLSWLPARGYLLVIDDADRLLSAAPDDLAVLVALLTGTGQRWDDRQAVLSDGSAGPVSFSSLLVCPPGTRAATTRRLAL